MAAEEGDGLVVSTKERAGPYDGLVTAKPGEPVFVVQGGDPHGPPTVLFWAKRAREEGMAEPNKKRARRLLRKASSAEETAWAMQAYQRGETAVEGRRASYQDDERHEAELDQARTERAARIRGAEILHNMLGGAAEVADTLARLRILPEQEVEIREAVEKLKLAAFAVEPRRGNERS